MTTIERMRVERILRNLRDGCNPGGGLLPVKDPYGFVEQAIKEAEALLRGE